MNWKKIIIIAIIVIIVVGTLIYLNQNIGSQFSTLLSGGEIATSAPTISGGGLV